MRTYNSSTQGMDRQRQALMADDKGKSIKYEVDDEIIQLTDEEDAPTLR